MMLKKVVAGTLVLTTILANGVVGYASGTVNTTKNPNVKVESLEETPKYQIFSPEKEKYGTTDKVVLLSGKAPEGTVVCIEVYATTDLTNKNFNLDNLPDAEDYVCIYDESLKVGKSGKFAKQIDLLLGINKILVTFKTDKESPTVEKIIYVTDLSQAKEAVDNMNDTAFSDLVKKSIK